MANAKTFKSNTGSPVHIYADSPIPIGVPSEAPYYETADKREIDALKGSPEVVEVKQPKK